MQFPDPGSICFVALSADNASERFAFVAMVDIPAGTVLTFTNGYWGNGQFWLDSGGSEISWQVPPGGMTAGQVVQIAPTVGTGPATCSHGTILYKGGYWDVTTQSPPASPNLVHNAVYVQWDDPSRDDYHDPFLTAIRLGYPDDGGHALWLEGTGLYAEDTPGSPALRHTALHIKLDPTKPFDQQDIYCIDRATAEGTVTYKEYQASAYNSSLNWRRDDGVDDGVGNNDPEGNPLLDPNSPMYGKWTLPVPTASAPPICFMPGTYIATPAGDVAVEDLRIGNAVMTSVGAVATVKWIGRQTISSRFADPVRVLPIRIGAGAIAENVPSRDLLVSPDHALLVDGMLVNAGALVNGTSITRERDVPATFTYYHVELHDHSLILAENTPAETFIDNVDRMGFDNWAEHEALYPDAEPIQEMAYPRAKAARQVPAAIRARLAARADLIVAPFTKAA
jgi:hypothetical protein